MDILPIDRSFLKQMLYKASAETSKTTHIALALFACIGLGLAIWGGCAYCTSKSSSTEPLKGAAASSSSSTPDPDPVHPLLKDPDVRNYVLIDGVNTLEYEFSPEATEQVQEILAMSHDSTDRVDYRDQEVITIDRAGSKDFDNALSIRKTPQGKFELFVHITDVSHFIKPDTPLDQHASTRSETAYFPGTTIPMLPPELSNDFLSLKEGEDRCTMTLKITYDKSGNFEGVKKESSIICSKKKLTYEEAQGILDGKTSPHQDMLFRLQEFCEMQLNYHNIASNYTVIETDAEGNPTNIKSETISEAQKIVRECMNQANYAASEHLEPNPALYLGQETSYAPVQYSRTPKLHDGLEFDSFTHFTNPLRRYADILVHRQLRNDALVPTEQNIENINLRHIIIKCAVTCVENRKKMRFLQQQSPPLKARVSRDPTQFFVHRAQIIGTINGYQGTPGEEILVIPEVIDLEGYNVTWSLAT